MGTETSTLGLPNRVERALDQLLASFDTKLKDELVAVLAHGSTVRGGYDEATSDVDLVVVLENDAIEVLERVANDIALARTSARIECMLLRKGEIPRAADVFPLLFEDLGAEGIALRGDNPFRGLRIEDDHRRLRIEQELRETRIRLRIAIADATAGLLRYEGLIGRKVRQIRSPLFALLQRSGHESKRDLKSVVAAAGKHLGVDTSQLLRFRESPKEAMKALVALLDAAIDHIDEPPGKAP